MGSLEEVVNATSHKISPEPADTSAEFRLTLPRNTFWRWLQSRPLRTQQVGANLNSTQKRVSWIGWTATQGVKSCFTSSRLGVTKVENWQPSPLLTVTCQPKKMFPELFYIRKTRFPRKRKIPLYLFFLANKLQWKQEENTQHQHTVNMNSFIHE